MVTFVWKTKCKADKLLDSFSITTTGNKPGYFAGDTAIEDFKLLPRLNIYCMLKISLLIQKTGINKTGVLISIVQDVETENQKRLQEYKVWYQVGGETVFEDVNASVANII